MWKAPPIGSNSNSNPSRLQTLHKTASQQEQRPQLLALRDILKFSKCITLCVSHAIISRDFQEECNFPQQPPIWNITLARPAETGKKTRKLTFFSIKMHQLFSSYIDALLVLNSKSSLQSSPHTPLPKDVTGKNWFLPFQFLEQPFSLQLFEQLREPK